MKNKWPPTNLKSASFNEPPFPKWADQFDDGNLDLLEQIQLEVEYETGTHERDWVFLDFMVRRKEWAEAGLLDPDGRDENNSQSRELTKKAFRIL